MTQETIPEIPDPVTREDLLESCKELFGDEQGNVQIKGLLYPEGDWPAMSVEITRVGNRVEDATISAKLTYLLTDGTRPESFIYLRSEPGKNATASADNYWAEPGPNARAMPIRPPFDEYTDVPSVFLNHVLLLSGDQYHDAVSRGFNDLWQLRTI